MASISAHSEQKIDIIESEAGFAMRKTDWKRIQRLINNLPENKKILSNLYSLCFGIGISSCFTIFSIYNIKNLQNWILPSLIAISISSIFLGIIIFGLDWKSSKNFRRDIGEINTQIKEINELYNPSR